AGQMVVLARLRFAATCPHLQRYLPGLLHALKAFRHWRKGNAQPLVFLLVPGRSNAKVSASLREDIQGSGGLHQNARIAISDARYQCAKLDATRFAGCEGQRHPPFKHLIFWRPGEAYLEEMIHDPHAIETGFIGTLRNLTKGFPKLALSVGPGENWNLQS